MALFIITDARIGGKKIPPLSYCSLHQSIDWHHRFECTYYILNSSSQKFNNVLNEIKDYVGKKIELRFRYSKSKDHDILNEFVGIVTEAKLAREISTGTEMVCISGYSPTILLEGRPACTTFSEMSLDEIVQAIHKQIPQNDLKIKSDPVFTSEIPFIVQYKESNFHFLNRIADTYGEWCFFDGNDLIFGKLPKGDSIPISLETELTDFECSLLSKNLNYTAVTYDYKENAVYTKDTKDYTVNDLDPFGDHLISQSEKLYKQKHTYYSTEKFKDERDFIDFFNIRKSSESTELVVNNGSSFNPRVRIGSLIKIISGHKSEQSLGEFIITSIQHQINDKGVYKNFFKAVPKKINQPPPNQNVRLPSCDVQPACVVDNDDPEQMGRVKIRFFWQEPKDSTPWLRIVHPYGGKSKNGEQHGFYFIPEIDDEVMVGFEGNNPDRPFVIGNVYHAKSKPDHWYDSDNNIKSIRTRNGNQIIFRDENGSEEIRILNTDDGSPTNEISLSLADDGKITIKSEGDLELSAENIKIAARTDITMESGQNTELTASDYKLDSDNGIRFTGQQVSITGQNSTNIKGESELELEGTNTSVKGQAELKLNGPQTKIEASQLKISGDAQTEITGATVKVSGSAITEIKGAMVKIN